MLREAARAGQPFDLLILDLEMPGMDGLELAARIRAEDRLSSLKLVFLTSMARRGEAKSAYEAGIAGYLTKPVRQAQLYACLRSAMGQATTNSPAGDLEIRTPPSRPATERRASEAERRTNIRLLIAEDNPVNQIVFSQILEGLGYSYLVAADGLEAVRLWEKHSPAVVLMDLTLSAINGIEAALYIRDREKDLTARTAIIGVLAQAFDPNHVDRPPSARATTPAPNSAANAARPPHAAGAGSGRSSGRPVPRTAAGRMRGKRSTASLGRSAGNTRSATERAAANRVPIASVFSIFAPCHGAPAGATSLSVAKTCLIYRLCGPTLRKSFERGDSAAPPFA